MLVATCYTGKIDAAASAEENGCRIVLEWERVAGATLTGGKSGQGYGRLHLY